LAKKKTKVPKKVAGVKVPKSVRKATIIDTVLNHPIGRAVLADALVAAAAAASAALVKHFPDKRDVERAGDTVQEAGSVGASMVKNVVTGAVGAIAHAAEGLKGDEDDHKEKRRRPNYRLADDLGSNTAKAGKH